MSNCSTCQCEFAVEHQLLNCSDSDLQRSRHFHAKTPDAFFHQVPPHSIIGLQFVKDINTVCAIGYEYQWRVKLCVSFKCHFLVLSTAIIIFNLNRLMTCGCPCAIIKHSLTRGPDLNLKHHRHLCFEAKWWTHSRTSSSPTQNLVTLRVGYRTN